MVPPNIREQLVAEFEASGQSVYAFAKARGIATSSLTRWRAQSKSMESVGERPSRLFARVNVAPGLAPIAPIEVHVGRARIVVPSHFDPKQLRAILDALGAIT
jgi:transposase-like protein